MSLRSEPGAMKAYQREYGRSMRVPARERAAFNAAISAASKGKCQCRTCVILRAIGTLRTASQSALDALTP